MISSRYSKPKNRRHHITGFGQLAESGKTLRPPRGRSLLSLYAHNKSPTPKGRANTRQVFLGQRDHRPASSTRGDDQDALAAHPVAVGYPPVVPHAALVQLADLRRNVAPVGVGVSIQELLRRDPGGIKHLQSRRLDDYLAELEQLVSSILASFWSRTGTPKSPGPIIPLPSGPSSLGTTNARRGTNFPVGKGRGRNARPRGRASAGRRYLR